MEENPYPQNPREKIFKNRKREKHENFKEAGKQNFSHQTRNPQVERGASANLSNAGVTYSIGEKYFLAALVVNEIISPRFTQRVFRLISGRGYFTRIFALALSHRHQRRISSRTVAVGGGAKFVGAEKSFRRSMSS